GAFARTPGSERPRACRWQPGVLANTPTTPCPPAPPVGSAAFHVQVRVGARQRFARLVRTAVPSAPGRPCDQRGLYLAFALSGQGEGRVSLRIGRLHHAQITIPDGAEEDGRQFYCGLLGLPEIDKPASLAGRGGFWLQVGDTQVHVGTEAGVDRLATKAHLAY